MVACSTIFYGFVILCQTIVILNLLSSRVSKKVVEVPTLSSKYQPESQLNMPLTIKSENIHPPIVGVAATLLLHSPKWFQRRYTMMVQNIRSNLPKNWAIQIFYTGEGQSLAGIELNIGLKRMIDKGEVILTLIPKTLQKYKRIELMVQPWIWENMAADRVLMFGGNSVICGNSPYNISYFDEWDYIGAPWSNHAGLGGEGGISLRNRHLMLEIIDKEIANQPIEQHNKILKSLGQEDHFYVSRIKKMLSDGKNIKIAPRHVTQMFGASESFYNENVLVVSGTLAGLKFEERDSFLSYCLELKMIYPSLHDPNCFGANPNGEKCAKNICALNPKKGGC